MRWWPLPVLVGLLALHLFAPWTTALYVLTTVYFPECAPGFTCATHAASRFFAVYFGLVAVTYLGVLLITHVALPRASRHHASGNHNTR